MGGFLEHLRDYWLQKRSLLHGKVQFVRLRVKPFLTTSLYGIDCVFSLFWIMRKKV